MPREATSRASSNSSSNAFAAWVAPLAASVSPSEIESSADLDRTVAFYTAAGFTETERHDGYLRLHDGPVELHFAEEASPTPGQCFIHVPDAVKLWKQLRHRSASTGDR
jgi:hypothetical protein